MPAHARLILSTILAGIVTPAVAVLFYEVGAALCDGDVPYLAFLLITAYWMVLAAILGAPFAIPVLLTVRLGNTWSAVPFIAVASAFGIEVQMNLNRLYEPDNLFDPVSLVLWLVWIIPAVFGTIAVLLLKWRPWITSLTIASIAMASLIVFVVVGINTARVFGHPYMTAATWSQLRAGAHFFAGDDGSTFSLTVCPSLAETLAEHTSEDCWHVLPGTPVIVDVIIPCAVTGSSLITDSPHVRLHAADGSWAGFAEAIMLQPNIPEGTVIELHRDWGAPLAMHDDSSRQIIVGDEAIVKVLRYDPRSDASLYVRINDGPHRDQTGWMSLAFADTGSPFGDNSLVYPYLCLN